MGEMDTRIAGLALFGFMFFWIGHTIKKLRRWTMTILMMTTNTPVMKLDMVQEITRDKMRY